MRIVLAGALGEVGRSLHAALTARGHEVDVTSSRAPIAGKPEVLALDEVTGLVDAGQIDALVHAGGPGDHREIARDVPVWSQQLADVCSEIPAILISTTRVLEGYEQAVAEDSLGKPLTEYARANTEHEQLWLTQPRAQVLRLVNYLCIPNGPESPQTKLLPWSLLLEGWSTGEIVVRSGADKAKEFIDAEDVVRAVEALIRQPAPERVVVAGPGAQMSMQTLVEACVLACSLAGRSGVGASFGNETGGSQWSIAPGWLVEQGWASNLTSDRMTEEMTGWLVEWDSTIPHNGRDRG